MNEEYERETGRKSNKYANFSVGKQSSVNFVAQNKRKSRKNSEYQKSKNPSSRDGSMDRMNDFNGLGVDDDDVRSRIDAGYGNDINIRNLREEINKREGNVNQKLNSMKERYSQQQMEIKSTLDSLMELQMEMDRKNKDRKASNNDFYHTLANENKSLLHSLRNKRNTMNTNLSHNSSFQHLSRAANLTPYEQQFGFQPQQNPNVHHESVFLNADAPQFANHESTNEALDDLISSYQPNNGGFSLPMPKSSQPQQQNEEYDDQAINVDEDMPEANEMGNQSNAEQPYSLISPNLCTV